MENRAKNQVVGWLDEISKEKLIPVILIGMIADGSRNDVVFRALGNMKTSTIKIIIQRVVDKINVLEAAEKEVMKCINGR